MNQRIPTYRRGASAGAVLRAVLEHGPVARSTIARLTGLSPASVSGHSAQFVRHALIRELPETSRSGGVGRPHTPVEVDTSAYVVASVHIAVPHVTVALLDLRGRVLAQRREPYARRPQPPAVIEAASALLTLLLDDHRPGAVPLGLGVAGGGWVDHESGTLVHHPLLGWRDVPLRETFAERRQRGRGAPPRAGAGGPDRAPARAAPPRRAAPGADRAAGPGRAAAR